MSDKTSDSELGDVIESLIYQYREFLTDEYNRNKEVPALISYAQKVPLLNRLIPAIDEKTQRIHELLEKQALAISYTSWYETSLELDRLMGHEAWKQLAECLLYDHELVANNLEEMRDARLLKNYKLLLYLIRTKWVRNVGNMGAISLYKYSFVGTKRLIEEYIEECKLSLQYLVNDESVNLDDRYLLGMLIQTRKSIGRTALVLSGGSTFGMFHIGVLLTLLEVNLLPRIISGSSAGSIVASILCCHNNEENRILIETLSEKEFEIFSSEGSREESSNSNNNDGDDSTKSGGDSKREETKTQFRKLLKGVGHFLKYGTLFEMEGLRRTVKAFVGDLTFREAYNRTGKILNITVSPAAMHDQTRLLNYLTAPNCLIWSAVCASCSLPGFFPSTSIYEKNTRTNKIQKWNNDSSIKFVDGSVDNDLPITRLLEMFNVDHIIAVQVNPHVVPILKVAISNPGTGTENDMTTKFKGVLNNVYDYFTSEFVHYLQVLNELNIYKNLTTKIISVLSQSYSGDITILPNFKVSDFKKIFVNPTPEFIADFIVRGARATWPKITLINNHCGVEFELDKAITLLRGRLIYSNAGKSTFKNSLLTNSLSGTIITDKSPSNVSTPSKLAKGDNSSGINASDDKSAETNGKPESRVQSTPDRKRVNSMQKGIPSIRRHNSVSGNYFGDSVHRRQRNSISNFQTFNQNNKRVDNRNSTTSLSAMYTSYNSPSKREAPARTHSDYNSHRRNSVGKIRKAKSSVNFQAEDTAVENPGKLGSRIPPVNNNPYLDAEEKQELNDAGSFEEGQGNEVEEENETEPVGSKEEEYNNSIGNGNTDNDTGNEIGAMNQEVDNNLYIYADLESFDSDYEIGSFTGYQTPTNHMEQDQEESGATIERERANLPRRSHNNSLTNSYIGLNRLKEANVSKSVSGSSNQSFTDPAVSWSSPDVRRALTKTFNDMGYDKKNERDREKDGPDKDGSDKDETDKGSSDKDGSER